ncbi:MAG: hypothetical protein J2P17_08490, partial [Mycobacterium sp.]|nr:hypothetical protein [Mycobacterium sp.]
SWEEDRVGEWFPVLTGRQSVLTVQGSEWLADQDFERKKCLFMGIRDMAAGTGVGDLESWAADRGVSFSDMYVSRVAQGPVDWSAILGTAESSGNYTVIIDSPEVTVLHRTTPVLARWPDSGDLSIATDCQSLGDQTPDVIATFQAVFTSRAGAEWVSEHEAALPPRAGLTGLLARSLAIH